MNAMINVIGMINTQRQFHGSAESFSILVNQDKDLKYVTCLFVVHQQVGIAKCWDIR